MACKISRLLSGKSGPTNRSHRCVKRLQAVQQWQDELGAPGPCGGMGAVPCCFSDEWTQSRDKKRTRRKSNMRGKRSNIIPGQTVHTMRQKTCCATLVGSVLNEKWIQTLLPHWRNRKDKAVGAATQELAAPTFLSFSRALWHNPWPPGRLHFTQTTVTEQTSPNRTGNSAFFTYCARSGPKKTRSSGR